MWSAPPIAAHIVALTTALPQAVEFAATAHTTDALRLRDNLCGNCIWRHARRPWSAARVSMATGEPDMADAATRASPTCQHARTLRHPHRGEADAPQANIGARGEPNCLLRLERP